MSCFKALHFLGVIVGGAGSGMTLTAAEPTVLDPVAVAGTRGIDDTAFLPSTVTAFDGDFITAHGITGYDELAPLVPGFFAADQSVDNVSLNLRGLTSDTNDPRVQPRVSVFQDGVELHNAHGNNVALFDLADVAVFKGPQPTQFGEGVQSGAVSLTSNRATNGSSGGLAAGVGDFSASTVEAFVNRPVVADTLFLRVAVYVNQRDGYVDNLADGSDLQGEGTIAFRTSLRWQPTAATTVDLIFNHQRDDTPGIAFKTSQGVAGFPEVTDTDPYTAANLNRGSELGILRTITGLTGIVRHELGDAWMLTATSAWREVENRHEFDADGSSIYLLELGERYKGRRVSQGLRFDYDGGGRLTASIGGNVAWSEDAQTVIIRTDENTLYRFLAGTPAPLPLNPRYSERHTNGSEVTSGDVFGRADYLLTDKLTLGGGLRLTHERLVSRYQSFAAPIPGNLTGFLPFSGDGNNVFRASSGRLEQSAEEQSWSGQLDARYALTPRLTLYTSVTRGRRPSVLTFDQMTLAPDRVGEETVWSYEAGIHGASANRRIRYEASVFRYDFENFQTERVVAPGVLAAFDGGRARGHGLEASVQADVTRRLTLFASYGFTDATFADRGEDGEPQAYAGNTFRLTSRHVVTLGGTLELPIDGRGTMFLTPFFTYRSEYYFEDDNDRSGGTLRQGGFGLLNLRLGYRSPEATWEVVGHVNNVLDKNYLLDAGNIGGGYGFPTTIAAAPRTIGVTATVRF